MMSTSLSGGSHTTWVFFLASNFMKIATRDSSLVRAGAVTAISAPLWGRVGDKYGSKLLVMRSLTAFILTKAGMAFVTAPWQLFALRALLGYVRTLRRYGA